MEAQKVQLGAGGALAVEVYARELRSHRQLILDTRNNTTVQEVERVSLVIRPMTDKGYRGYFLHLYVSQECRVLGPILYFQAARRDHQDGGG
jgi:hypothetical protein